MAQSANEVRKHLVEVGGRMTQDLGLGRIFGQVLVYIYLSDGEKSLDDIGADLGLSKASVSIAARQLESLGLVSRVWKTGDKKNYYKTVNNLAAALQNGVLEVVRGKIRIVSSELEHAHELLEKVNDSLENDPDCQLIRERLALAKKWEGLMSGIITSPAIGMLLDSK